MSSIFTVKATAQTIPVATFASLPDSAMVSLSPNGKKLVSLTRVANEHINGVTVEVTELKSGNKKQLLSSDNNKYFIRDLRWKDNKTLLVTAYFPSERDSNINGRGQVKFKSRDFRLYILNTESGEVNRPFTRNFLKKFHFLPSNLANIVDILPDEPEHILMSLPARTAQFEQNRVTFNSSVVYKVDITNKTNRVIQAGLKGVYNWQTDRQHNVRIGTSFKNGIVTTHVKNIDSGDWQALWPYKVFSEDEVNVKGFGQDPNELYISAYHNKRKAIFKVNLADPKLTREIVHAHDFYDVDGGLLYSKTAKKVIGLSSNDGDMVFFEADLRSIKKSINKSLAKTVNYIYSIADDMQSYIVYSTGDTESGTYYLGQRNPTKLSAIKYRYNNLPPKDLVKVQEYSYKARDGLTIQGYLALPHGQVKNNLPTIVFPHGGPQARDSKAFDYWVQFFASKGYAVLQMNFRGSDGQGIIHRSAGLKNWGKEMQDDIEDGAKQLIADGITDANQICIAGASYGGYAALMGVVKTPNFYQCAISIAGVSSVYDLVRDNRRFWASYNVVEEQVGSMGSHLHAISPVTRAKEIKVPVLLVHGDSDRQVNVKHSRNMRDELKKSGKKYTYVELLNEDHYLANETNRLTTFNAMSDFLDEHLPVNIEE